MKKIFIVCGEASGDRLAAWYIKNLKEKSDCLEIEAIGGSFLEAIGIKLYDNIKNLSIVGFVEVIKKLFFVFKYIRKLTQYILSNKFDEVVLVDFPGFNLRLAKKLKRLNPDLKITYFSPPQLWVWGEKRIKYLKNYCDKVVVIYPFEVEWYSARGLSVEWIEYPFYKDLVPYFESSKNKEKMIAFLLGSRKSEMEKLLPVFVKIATKIRLIYPGTKILLPLASTFSQADIKKNLRSMGFILGNDIIFSTDEKTKLELVSKSALAISKPGTISLELALLGVPSIIIYKVSPLTFWLATKVVKVSYMALPNLFLNKEVFLELLQKKCQPNLIFKELDNIYSAFLNNQASYQEKVAALTPIRTMFLEKN